MMERMVDTPTPEIAVVKVSAVASDFFEEGRKGRRPSPCMIVIGVWSEDWGIRSSVFCASFVAAWEMSIAM